MGYNHCCEIVSDVATDALFALLLLVSLCGALQTAGEAEVGRAVMRQPAG